MPWEVPRGDPRGSKSATLDLLPRHQAEGSAITVTPPLGIPRSRPTRKVSEMSKEPTISFYFDVDVTENFFLGEDEAVDEFFHETFGKYADSLRNLIPLVREYGVRKFFELSQDDREELLTSWDKEDLAEIVS